MGDKNTHIMAKSTQQQNKSDNNVEDQISCLAEEEDIIEKIYSLPENKGYDDLVRPEELFLNFSDTLRDDSPLGFEKKTKAEKKN